MKACVSCGRECTPGTRFCAHCGTSSRGTQALVAPLSTSLLSQSERDDLLGDRRIVTVLFTDVSGFTSMSEALDPEEVVDIVNALFRVLTEPIYRYGGIVDKYIGDAIMAVFGALVVHEDDAQRALSAAWEMQRAAKSFGERLEARTGTVLAIRIGLNSGLVVASRVGGAEKQEYTVMGDTVNLAQRMESNARVGGILLTEETRRLAGDRFEYRKLAAITVKGRRQAVSCHELVGPARLQLTAHRGLVGRSREEASLQRAWSRAQDGLPTLVWLHGEGGSGKSALVASLFSNLPSVGSGLRASSSAFDANVPLRLAQCVLRAAIGLDDTSGASVEDFRIALWTASPAKADDAEATAALGFLLDLFQPSAEFEVSPEHFRPLIFAHLCDLLRERARWEPFVLFLDNFQWADEASIDWLRMLVSTLAGEPVGIVLVLAARPTAAKETYLPKLESTEINLGALGPVDARTLLVGELSQDRVAAITQSVIDTLVVRAGGNAGYLIAFASMLSDVDLQQLPTKEIDSLPIWLISHISSQIDALELSKGAKAALEAAAVRGMEFLRSDLAELLESGLAEQAISELVAKGVLIATDSFANRLVFATTFHQEVAYQRILAHRRRRLHAKVAESLKRGTVSAAVIAEHFVQARMLGKAAQEFLIASQRALACFANREALRVADKAEQCSTGAAAPDLPPDFHIELLICRVRGLQAIGDFGAALALSLDLVSKTVDHSEQSAALERHAGILLKMGRLAEALSYCERGLNDGPAAEPFHLQLQSRRAQLRMRLGDLGGALADSNDVLSKVSPDQGLIRGFVLLIRGAVRLRLGETKRAQEDFEAAIAQCHLVGDLYGMAHGLSDLGVAWQRLGAQDEALRCFERGQEIATRIGERRLKASLLNNLGLVVHLQGRIAKADAHFKSALAVYRDLGDLLNSGTVLINLGETSVALGNPELAEELLVESVQILEEIGARDILGEAYKSLAAVRFARNCPAEALAALKLCHATATLTGQTELLGISLRMISEVHLSCGRLQDALTWAQKSVRALESVETPLEIGRSLRQLGSSLGAQGMLPSAREAFERAANAFRQAGAANELEAMLSQVDCAR